MRTLVLAALVLAAPAVAQPGQKLAADDWHGIGLQVDPSGIQSTWTIDMSINAQRSTINYPSLGCTGALHRISATPTQIVFREQITEGDCIDSGRITVMLENGRIFWFWTKPGLDADASAVLYPSRPVA